MHDSYPARSVSRAGSETVASLTEVRDGFFDVRKIHICCQIAFTWLMEDVYNLVIFECLSCQRISVNVKTGTGPALTRNESPYALSPP